MISTLKLFAEFLKDKRYRTLSISTLVMLFGGTVFYHLVEGWKWLDSLYFSVITLSTVGYGDFSPVTNVGKVFTMVYLITGIGLLFGFINAFYQHRVDRHKKIKERLDGIKENRKKERKEPSRRASSVK